MPQVPVYEGPQVRSAPLQPVYQNTPDVSSGGRAVAQGLAQVAEAADRIDLRDAQTKASAAERDITAQWLQWDAKARTEYRGEKVDGYLPAAQEWWKKAAETYGADLNPRAKSIASQSLSGKQVSALGNVGTFVAAEKERHADEVYNADVATTIQFGVTSGNVASTAQQLREKAAVTGARKGWTTEQVQAEANKHLSNMHIAYIAKIAESDAKAAQQYYNDNEKEIDAAAQGRIKGVVDGEAANQTARQFAASVADKPLADQLAAAAKIEDPKVREKTLTEVRNNYALVSQARREAEAQAADKAYQLMAQGKKIPEALLAAMDGKERINMQEIQRQRAERLAQGKPVKTDFATWYDVQQRILAGEKVDLRQFQEKIGRDDLQNLTVLQQKPDKVLEAKIDADDFNSVADSMGLRPYQANTEDRKRELGTLKSRVESLIDIAQRNKKGPLTREEKRQIMRTELGRTVTVNPGWFSSNRQVPVISMKRDEIEKVEVPASERAKLLSEMQQLYNKNKSPEYAPTEFNVKRYFLIKKSPAAAFIE